MSVLGFFSGEPLQEEKKQKRSPTGSHRCAGFEIWGVCSLWRLLNGLRSGGLWGAMFRDGAQRGTVKDERIMKGLYKFRVSI